MSDQRICLLCGEPIDRGEEESPASIRDAEGRSRKAHNDCAVRSIVGGIGHLENHDHWCVKVGDPDGGLSYRESSRLVRFWIEDHGLPGDYHTGDTP